MIHELPENALETELLSRRVDPEIAGKWARIYADLHPKQREAIDDEAKRQVWEKGRRGGGSFGAAAKLLKNYHQWGGHTSLFGALTKEHARRIIWPTLDAFNAKYELGGKPNSGPEMSWSFPTGDGHEPYRILVCAMKDRAQIEKLRGISGGLRSAVIDECFVADTPVRAVGDITRVIAKPAPHRLVTVNGITSTENHPYLTPDGWKRAADLGTGDMLCVWDDFHSDPTEPCATKDVFESMSLRELFRDPTGEYHAHTAAVAQLECLGAASPGNATAKALVCREVLEDASGAGPSTTRARRERPWAYVAGTGIVEGDWTRRAFGRAHGSASARRSTYPLQIGPRECISEAGRGSGRQQPPDGGGQAPRCSERRVARWARVDCIEIHERGGVGRYDEVCPDGKVYNLTTESGLYLAGGALVHNCGSFVAHDSQFRDLIRAVIMPQFMDTFHLGGGELTLLGSPALDPRGFFFERVKGRTHDGKPATPWSRHYWTALHNTHMDAAGYFLEELKDGDHIVGDASPEELVRAMVALKDVELDDPRWAPVLSSLSVTFRREYLAEWVTDSDSLIYVPTAVNMLPEGHFLDETQPWRVVIGCDIGWGDGNGFTVAAKSLRGREIILCESYFVPEMTDEEIAKELLALQQRYRTTETYVDDVGHGDRLVANMSHFGITVAPAARGRKKPRIEYARTLLRSGALQIRPERCPHLLSEMAALPWDEDRQTHRENFYDDVVDSFLAAINGLGQLFLPARPKRPKRGEEGWEREEARREREAANRAGRRIHRAGRRKRFRGS